MQNGPLIGKGARRNPKAKPIILTTRDEIDLWMTVPAEAALKLQKPCPMMHW
jgi:hypothetical protein